MTSLFTRIQTLFVANANARLDQHENPAVMARQILRDIDTDRDRTRQQLVRGLATTKELEHRKQRLRGQHDQLLQQARTALDKGRQDKARGLVARAARRAAQADAADGQSARVRDHVARLRRLLEQLQDERDEALHQVQMIELAGSAELATEGGDVFSTTLRRREQLAAYAARAGGDDCSLEAAVDLLDEAGRDGDPDLDARTDALWATLTEETGQ